MWPTTARPSSSAPPIPHDGTRANAGTTPAPSGLKRLRRRDRFSSNGRAVRRAAIAEWVAALLDVAITRRRTTLRVTDATFAALNLEPHDAAVGADGGQEADTAVVDATPAEEASVGPTAPATPKVRAGTKQAQLIEMLKRPEGATVDEIVAAFGWQPHTVRGAIAGALKKKLGLDVTSEKVDGRGRVYRL